MRDIRIRGWPIIRGTVVGLLHLLYTIPGLNPNRHP